MFTHNPIVSIESQILEKVKDMLEINTRVNWDSAEIEPNEEFQNILDEISSINEIIDVKQLKL